MAIFKKPDLLLFADFILLPMVIGRHPIKKRNLKACAVLLTCAFAIGSPKFIKDILKKEKMWIDFNKKFELVEFTPIGYQLVDLVAFIKQKSHRKLNASDRRIIESYFEARPPEVTDTTFLYLKGIANGFDVIIIQVESLPNFVINRNHMGTSITPNLNRLLSNSLYFTDIHSQVRSGNTSDAEFMALTSLLPIERGSVFMQYTHNTYFSLPKILKPAGYSTSAFHGNDKCFWNRGEMYKALGINRFYDIRDIMGSMSARWWLMNDSLVLHKATEVLLLEKQPFFSLIVTLENHLGSYKDNNGFFDGVRTIDKKIGWFIDRMIQAERGRRTLFVIYGDHMPSVDLSELEKSRDFSGTNFSGRNIPLIVFSPVLKGRVINKIAGQVDILPTLLYLLGLDPGAGKGKILGRNILTSDLNFVNCFPGKFLCNGSTIDPTLLATLSNQYLVSDLIIRGNYFH